MGNTIYGIVIDTNVFVSALMSRQGLSYRLLQLVGTGSFEICVSVPLILEYEDAAKRLVGAKIALSEQRIDDVIDYLCSVARRHQSFYLLRPTLSDPRDDMVLELAVGAGCDFIVTYNLKDFREAEHFAVEAVMPKKFLEKIGELP